MAGGNRKESAGLSDSLVKSAKALFNGKENTSHAVRKDETPAGPMDKTFAPLLRLIGDTTEGGVILSSACKPG